MSRTAEYFSGFALKDCPGCGCPVDADTGYCDYCDNPPEPVGRATPDEEDTHDDRD